jgi:FixJ family two-component response regulator
MGAGAFAFLYKPVRSHALLREIRKALGTISTNQQG